MQKRGRENRDCEVCGGQFSSPKSRPKRTCSRLCSDRLRAAASSATQCRKVALVCEHCGTSKLVSPAYRSRRFCSRSCSYARRRGPLSSTWKGGITSEHQAFFSSTEWKRACAAVWARDRRTCQRCGAVHSGTGKLHEVHHIGSWGKFPELRLDLGNLSLLCFGCHKWVHSRHNAGRLFLRT